MFNFFLEHVLQKTAEEEEDSKTPSTSSSSRDRTDLGEWTSSTLPTLLRGEQKANRGTEYLPDNPLLQFHRSCEDRSKSSNPRKNVEHVSRICRDKKKNHYDILMVPHGANPTVITKAYKECASVTHPGPPSLFDVMIT